MYDRNHDMKIDRTELLAVLRMMVGGNIHEDQITTIADHTINELVIDLFFRMHVRSFVCVLGQ